MGAKPQLCYNRICVINNRVIMRLQCMFEHQGHTTLDSCMEATAHPFGNFIN